MTRSKRGNKLDWRRVVPRNTAQDERRSVLATYMHDLRKHPHMPHERMMELFQEYTSTSDPKLKQRLFETLLETNLRLVVSIAKSYRKSTSIPLIDLIQEGNLGLIKGIERFDHTRGFHLSTYASWWIRQGISRYIVQQKHMIRMPVHASNLKSRVNKYIAEHKAKHNGVEPSIDSICDGLDASKLMVSSALRSSTQQVTAQVDVNDVFDTVPVTSQVDASDPSQPIITKEIMRIVQGVLDKLSMRELAIIRLRFGLVEQHPEQFAVEDKNNDANVHVSVAG